jgi:hypothetical protein
VPGWMVGPGELGAARAGASASAMNVTAKAAIEEEKVFMLQRGSKISPLGDCGMSSY